MYHSKHNYYLQFLLIFAFLFLGNVAIACEFESDDDVCISEYVPSTFYSNSINSSSSNHKEYPSEEKDEELEEQDCKEEVRKKGSKKDVIEYASFYTLPEVLRLKTLLTKKIAWSILIPCKNIHRHNQTLHVFYCVFLC